MTNYHSIQPAKLVLFCLLAGYPILAAASTTNGFPEEIRDTLKYIRIATLVTCFLIGSTWFQFPKAGEATRALLIFATFFVFAGAWSADPFWAFAYKSFFLASVITGVCLALAVKTEYDLIVFCRYVVSFGIAGIALIACAIQWNSIGDMFSGKGQLWIGPVNPNTMAQTAAIYFIISVLAWKIDTSFNWRSLAFACATLALILVFFSGSRGGMLTALAGGSLVAILVRPISTNFVIVSSFAIVILAAVFFVLTAQAESEPVNFLNEEAEFRFLDSSGLMQDTRSGEWMKVINAWQESPIIGIGWNAWRRSWGTVFSAYLQVLLESGIVGIGLLAFFVFRIMGRIRVVLFVPGSFSIRHSIPAAFASLVLALLFHGVAESSLVLGTTPHAFLLAFATQKLDLEVADNQLI